MPDISPRDRDLWIRTVIGEADKDPSALGVAHVIANRMRDTGQSASQVVLAPNQFEPWSTRRRELLSYAPDSAPYRRAANVVDSVISGETDDPTGGAKYFYAPAAQAALGRRPPAWDTGPGQMIGGHKFIGGNPDVAEQIPDYAASIGKKSGKSAAPQPEDDIPDYAGAIKAKDVTPPPSPAPASKTMVATAAPQTAALPLQRVEGEPVQNALAKNIATGAIKGVADVPGVFGNIANFGDYLGANIAAAIHGGTPEEAMAAHNARLAAAAGSGNALAQNYLTARNYLPSGETFSKPVLAGTGEYVPAQDDALGRVLQSGVEGATGAYGLGGLGNVGGALRAGAGTGVAQGVSEATGSPGAGLAAALVAPGLLKGGRGALEGAMGTIDPERAQLANLAQGKYGIPMHPGQLSESKGVNYAYSALGQLPFSGAPEAKAAQNSAWYRAISNEIGEDTPKITKGVWQSAQKRIGAVFDDVGSRTNIDADPKFQQGLVDILNGAEKELSPQEMHPLHSIVENIGDKIDQNGQIPGDVYNAIVRKGGPLERALKNNQSSSVKYWAGQIRGALDNAFDRSAPDADKAALSQARGQYRALTTIEPLIKKSPDGSFTPAAFINRVGQEYGIRGKPTNLRELADIGAAFMKEPADSGTAGRVAALSSLSSVGKALGTAALGLAGAKDLGLINMEPGAAAMTLGSIPLALGAGRVASNALRSPAIANSIINRSLQPGGFNWPSVNGVGSALYNAGTKFNALAPPR